VLIDGAAHGQRIFSTPAAEMVMREILADLRRE
jgi:hypothetical protein